VEKAEELELVGAGYPRGFLPKNGIVIDPVCGINGKIETPDSESLQTTTTCAADRGASGGPIVTRDDYPLVIGLYCAGLGSNKGTDFPLQQPYPDVKHNIANFVTPTSAIYDRVKEIMNRPSERDYILKNSKQAPPEFGKDSSSAGQWQQADSGAPAMPVLFKNRATEPKNWSPVLDGPEI
jgi:hypothetical protein